MWEITRVGNEDTSILNKHFADGWEPFAVIPTNHSHHSEIIYLRRKKQ